MKIINFTKEMYTKLNGLQRLYLTSILGAYITTDDLTLRMIFGLPKLSDFLMKIKLSMYYDILKNTNMLQKYSSSEIFFLRKNITSNILPHGKNISKNILPQEEYY